MSDTPRRRYGPEPLPPEQQRDHRFSVYVTESERAEVERRAALVGMRPPAYLREAGLSRLPHSVPQLNREAWVALARTAANLNQLAKHLNQSGYTAFDCGPIAAAVNDLRNALIGIQLGQAE